MKPTSVSVGKCRQLVWVCELHWVALSWETFSGNRKSCSYSKQKLKPGCYEAGVEFIWIWFYLLIFLSSYQWKAVNFVVCVSNPELLIKHRLISPQNKDIFEEIFDDGNDIFEEVKEVMACDVSPVAMFLAVQNSSIGDLVTHSLTDSLRVLLLLTYKERP